MQERYNMKIFQEKKLPPDYDYDWRTAQEGTAIFIGKSVFMNPDGDVMEFEIQEFKEIAKSIKARQKNSVLNIRINSEDLEQIKRKADKLGVKYQSFISELLHRVAGS